MLTSMVITLSILLSILPANPAQDPMPTPIPTPEDWPSCQPGTWAELRENDTSITTLTDVEAALHGQLMYALECLSQDSDCRADRVLGYAGVGFCWKWSGCAHIALSRPLRGGEYVALYTHNVEAPPYPPCSWDIYRVSGIFLPRQYLPLLLK